MVNLFPLYGLKNILIRALFLIIFKPGQRLLLHIFQYIFILALSTALAAEVQHSLLQRREEGGGSGALKTRRRNVSLKQASVRSRPRGLAALQPRMGLAWHDIVNLVCYLLSSGHRKSIKWKSICKATYLTSGSFCQGHLRLHIRHCLGEYKYKQVTSLENNYCLELTSFS